MSTLVPNARASRGPVGGGERISRPRFAFVAPYLPAPEDSGGRIRMAALARALAGLGEVELFARVWPAELTGVSARRLSALRPYARTQLFARDLPAGVPGIHPWRARDATPMGLLRALRARHEALPFDAVVACHAYASLALRGLGRIVTVVDEHNIESRYARDVLLAPWREWRAMERLEARAWRGASLITCVRDDDARLIAARTGAEVAVIPNGTRLDAARWRLPSTREGHRVIFVGAMSHRPNVEAAVFLAREVLPRLRSRWSDARLVLCGRDPDAAVRALAGPQVEVTGTVDAVAPYLDQASVFANPLRAGEGTSLKVLDALGAGLSLVSTQLGARGLPLLSPTHMLCAESPEQFVDAIAAVWARPDEADERARAAREAIRDYDWSSLSARFAERVCARVEAQRSTR